MGPMERDAYERQQRDSGAYEDEPQVAAELLRLTGEGVQVGDMPLHELEKMAGQPAFSLRLPDERVVVVIGLTRAEARACVPGFMAPARFTVSAA